MTGKTIGKYRILGRLGSGGMGTVYKAVDETLEREVAIKVLNRGVSDPKILQRFRAEATTLAKLNHPAIATIYELFQHQDELLIVMEFVRGETLETLALRTGVFSPEQAVFVVDRVLSALAHTHRAGIVHCDIKPANVMVTVQGGVKMMDFGTARAHGAEHGTVQGYMMGTPAYMPPEQLLGHQLDGRADLYAVGVLFYRLVTGTFPFTADTPIEAMRKQISDAPTPAIAVRGDLPDWCDYIVMRALAKLPADRFQTADGFRDALRDASGFTTAEPRRVLLAPMVHAGGDASREPTIVEPVHVSAPPADGSAPVRSSATVRPQGWGSRRARWARPMAGAVAVAIPLLTAATLRAPIVFDDVPAPSPILPTPASALPAPEEILLGPEKSIGSRASAAFAFDARVMTGNQKSQQECKCRVVLANGRIIWRSEDKAHAVYAVGYDHVASIAYSHGRDPLWNGPGGPTPVVRGSRGPFAFFFTERDWLALRVTESPLRYVVLRFDDRVQARNAINALEERIGRRIERLPKRQS